MYRSKVFDGLLVFTADHSTPPGLQLFKKLEAWSQVWLKAVLAVLLVALVWAWVNALQPPHYSYGQMQDYAVQYLNANR